MEDWGCQLGRPLKPSGHRNILMFLSIFHLRKVPVTALQKSLEG